MTDTTHWIRTTLGGLILFSGLAPGGMAGGMGQGGLSLEVRLDSPAYRVAAPIVAIVTVKNESSEAFRDMAYLDPPGGNLRLQLTSAGKDLPSLGRLDTRVYLGEGMTLLPGESMCEIINVLDRFGKGPGDAYGLRTGRGYLALPPGKYELSVSFTARLGMVKRLPQAELQSGTVSFEILASPFGRGADSALVALCGDRGHMAERRTEARGIFKQVGLRGLHSGYVVLAAVSGLAPEDVLPTEPLVRDPSRQGLNAAQAAAILKYRFENVEGSVRQRRAWVAKLRGRAKVGEVVCLLHSFDKLLDETAKRRGSD